MTEQRREGYRVYEEHWWKCARIGQKDGKNVWKEGIAIEFLLRSGWIRRAAWNVEGWGAWTLRCAKEAGCGQCYRPTPAVGEARLGVYVGLHQKLNTCGKHVVN